MTMCLQTVIVAGRHRTVGAATERYQAGHGISRQDQDAFAAESHARAAAIKDGRLAEEIVPVATVRGRKGRRHRGRRLPAPSQYDEQANVEGEWSPHHQARRNRMSTDTGSADVPRTMWASVLVACGKLRAEELNDSVLDGLSAGAAR